MTSLDAAMSPAREEILDKVRAALKRDTDGSVPSATLRADPPVPESARVVPREPGNAQVEIDLLLAEIQKLSGVANRIARDDLQAALAELIRVEEIRRAVLWDTETFREFGLDEMARALASLGIEIVSSRSDKHRLAECDLGVTSVDAALPETGTLLLRSSDERPRLVSLLPRVHLAIVHPSTLCADLDQALAAVKGEGYFVLITGPSRTADIELTVTLGVHGPKALYVWVLEE